jgi:hypothetical protein
MIVRECDYETALVLNAKYVKLQIEVDTAEITRHINCHRYIATREMLLKYPHDYVFVCDSRDVMFQRNLQKFEFSKEVDMYVSEENLIMMNEPQFNIPWIKRLEVVQQESILPKVFDKPVLCSGTFLGRYSAMLNYFTVVNVMKAMQKDNLDQAILNYIFYMNKLPAIKMKALSNRDELVMTLGFCNGYLCAESRVLNDNGKIPYVLHQYDRLPLEAKKEMSVKYDYTK